MTTLIEEVIEVFPQGCDPTHPEAYRYRITVQQTPDDKWIVADSFGKPLILTKYGKAVNPRYIDQIIDSQHSDYRTALAEANKIAEKVLFFGLTWKEWEATGFDHAKAETLRQSKSREN